MSYDSLRIQHRPVRLLDIFAASATDLPNKLKLAPKMPVPSLVTGIEQDAFLDERRIEGIGGGGLGAGGVVGAGLAADLSEAAGAVGRRAPWLGTQVAALSRDRALARSDVLRLSKVRVGASSATYRPAWPEGLADGDPEPVASNSST